MQPGTNWLDNDPCFEALGQTDQQRLRAWQAFVAEAIPAEQLEVIRSALQRGQLTSSERFVREIEQVKAWRQACISGQMSVQAQRQAEREQARTDKKRIRELEVSAPQTPPLNKRG